jgi:hypothetical protein
MYRNTRLGRAGKVQVSAGRFGTQDELAALYARAHCVVALSRAEGWGFAPSRPWPAAATWSPPTTPATPSS